ncbi:hypothetical protein AB0M97_15435 [Streptomyces sp. NPDC051207]|uniref:hypothetical protein n=1 Tax=Streptomyces sp. NPDC051207 TaxID=3154641 RepID=UPI0034258F93
MSPDAPAPDAVRSAAELNEQIRALWLRTGGSLSAEERAEYEQLVAAWAAAVRGAVTEAA